MIAKLLKVLAWLLVAGLVAATVVPASERPVTGVPHNYEHFLSFAVSAFVFALAHPNLRPRPLYAAGVAFTLALELMQIPLPTRHARLEDFLYDTAAVWCAFAAVRLAALPVLARLARVRA